MNYTPLAELAIAAPEPQPKTEPVPTSYSFRPDRSPYCRTEILLVGEDRVQAESEIRSRSDTNVVDEIFVVRDSNTALDVLCRLREFEYRHNDRDLRVVLMDPRCDHSALQKLAVRLSQAENVAHFPIVRAECTEDGSVEFAAVHHHEFEDLLDSTRVCCVLLWESCRIAA